MNLYYLDKDQSNIIMIYFEDVVSFLKYLFRFDGIPFFGFFLTSKLTAINFKMKNLTNKEIKRGEIFILNIEKST